MADQSTIELQLLRWGEGPTGRTVTFLLPEDPGPHPFKGLRTGPANGQRLGAAFALIHDDETTTPHEPAVQPSGAATFSEHPMPEYEYQTPDTGSVSVTFPSPAPAQPASGRNGNGAASHRLAQQAALCCQDARFRRFLEETLSVTIGTLPDDAADYVRLFCGVKSRAEFDTDPEAAARWRELHSKYIAWREAP